MTNDIGFWVCLLIANLWAMSSHEFSAKGLVIYAALAAFHIVRQSYLEIKNG
jgi:hypothetical protein